MQVEFNESICRKNIIELQKTEYKLRRMAEQLMTTYAYFRIRNDIVEKEVAKKIHKEISSLEREIRNVSVMAKSLEKIYEIYEKNETNLTQCAEDLNRRFLPKFGPVDIKSIVLLDHIPNGIDLVLYKDLK